MLPLVNGRREVRRQIVAQEIYSLSSAPSNRIAGCALLRRTVIERSGTTLELAEIG
jgi:hypothetical protein